MHQKSPVAHIRKTLSLERLVLVRGFCGASENWIAASCAEAFGRRADCTGKADSGGVAGFLVAISARRSDAVCLDPALPWSEKGETGMHADKADARGFRLDRYWFTASPVAVEARYPHC